MPPIISTSFLLIARPRPLPGRTIGYKKKVTNSVEEFLNLQGTEVLLVEDNTLNQELANLLLTRKGISVTLANNGAEALEILQTTSFDCVLMDIQMPVMDGYTASREIRKIPQYQDLPIIALTANAMSTDQEKKQRGRHE